MWIMWVLSVIVLHQIIFLLIFSGWIIFSMNNVGIKNASSE